MTANWDKLLPDLLTVIVKKIDLYEDFVAFGGVCRSWRLVAVKENFNQQQLVSCSSSSFSVQPPWLMLAEEEGTETREFVNMSKGGMFKKIALPEARGKHCLGSMGWLITIDQEGGMDLLHPLTRVSISLPHLRTYPLYEDNMEEHFMFPVDYIYRATLSASPSATQDYAVMLILGVPIKMAFWKPGNAGWMFLDSSCYPIDDVTYHQGKFYAAGDRSNILAWDVGGPNPTVEMVGTIPRRMYLGDGQIYLTEYCGDLILVKKLVNKEEDKYWSMEFRICKLAADSDGDDDDSTTRRRRGGYYKWEEVNDLGGGSIFVGFNTPISVPCAAAVGLKPNCIYFTDDYCNCCHGFAVSDDKVIGGIDMGIYNLETKSTEPLYCRASLSNLCPPMWVSPSF